jgi:hypothetical protein
MKRYSTVAGPYLAIGLLIATGLSVHGCGDSATVNPVVELASLTVTPGTLQPAFKGSTTDYSVDLTADTTSATVSAQPAVSGDAVSIDGEARTSHTVTLGNPGSTTSVSIVVSESNNNSRTYTVLLRRASVAGNNSLQSLTVSPGALAPEFTVNELFYTVDVDNTVGSVTVTPTLDDPAATMTMNGQAATSGVARTISLTPAGQSTLIEIAVRAQDGNVKQYHVSVSRGVSANNNLRGLTISPGTISPAFTASNIAYTVNVGSTVANFTVTPRLQDATATMTVNGQATNSGLARTIPLREAGLSTLITIVVTAQNGVQKTYSVEVRRAALDGNNNLSALAVSPGSLSPSFSASRTSYTVDVGGSVESITVTAAREDTSASLTIAGQGTGSRSISLPPGPSSTEVEVIVTAQNGTPKIYLITVNRAALSADNNLEALSVSPGALNPVFSAGTPQYTVAVATDVTAVTVTATKSDPNAVISGDIPNQGQATIQLDGPGTSKTVSIIVTAPNGTSKTYRTTVNRAAPSSDNNLSLLTVTPGSLSPGFSPSILDYDVSSGAASVGVSATKSDPNAVMSGSVTAGAGVRTGSATILLGGPEITTRITITVTAPNGSSKTYTITVSRPFR